MWRWKSFSKIFKPCAAIARVHLQYSTIFLWHKFEALWGQWLDEGMKRKSSPFLDERAALLKWWLLGYEWRASQQPNPPPPTPKSVSMATVSQGFLSHCLSYCICGGREKDITEDSQQKDESRLGLACLSLNKSGQERVISNIFCKLDGWIFLFCISNTLWHLKSW